MAIRKINGAFAGEIVIFHKGYRNVSAHWDVVPMAKKRNINIKNLQI